MPVGGAAYCAQGHSLPPDTLAERADAILFGAVGDPEFDALERSIRPEQAILGLRREDRPRLSSPRKRDMSPTDCSV